jgi:hypothetical protein
MKRKFLLLHGPAEKMVHALKENFTWFTGAKI